MVSPVTFCDNAAYSLGLDVRFIFYFNRSKYRYVFVTDSFFFFLINSRCIVTSLVTMSENTSWLVTKSWTLCSTTTLKCNSYIREGEKINTYAKAQIVKSNIICLFTVVEEVGLCPQLNYDKRLTTATPARCIDTNETVQLLQWRSGDLLT